MLVFLETEEQEIFYNETEIDDYLYVWRCCPREGYASSSKGKYTSGRLFLGGERIELTYVERGVGFYENTLFPKIS